MILVLLHDDRSAWFIAWADSPVTLSREGTPLVPRDERGYPFSWDDLPQGDYLVGLNDATLSFTIGRGIFGYDIQGDEGIRILAWTNLAGINAALTAVRRWERELEGTPPLVGTAQTYTPAVYTDEPPF